MNLTLTAGAFGLAALATVSAMPAAAQDLTLRAPVTGNSVTLQANEVAVIPYGNSVSGAMGIPALSFVPDHLAVGLIGAGCVLTITSVQVGYSGVWANAVPAADGTWILSGAQAPTAVQLDVSQTTYVNEECTYQITLSASGDQPAPTGDWTLIGAINFGGGFASRLPLMLATPGLVTMVHVDVPAFCAQTEVLEVGTISDGVYTAARALASAGDFQVNGGAGLIASELEVTFNGPVNTACSLPIYLK